MIGGRGKKKKSLSSLCSARHTQEITFMCSDWLVWLGLSESSIEQLQAFCAFGCVAFFSLLLFLLCFTMIAQSCYFTIPVTKGSKSFQCIIIPGRDIDLRALGI